MRTPVPVRLWALPLVTGLSLLAQAATPALADPKDYRFEAVSPHVAAAPDTRIAVRLIHLPDNKPVADAVIFGARLEMPMSGMAPMAGKVTALKPAVSGEYPFQADVSMAGNWILKLSAKVQGETGTVTGDVPFMAMK
ncbi:MAG: FixH family protein [Telmatospirillum sp.]|nr:FixH family protein [Telmatospirillum sp.]